MQLTVEKVPSYIKSSKHFVRMIETQTLEASSLEVISLYPTISMGEAQMRSLSQRLPIWLWYFSWRINSTT